MSSLSKTFNLDEYQEPKFSVIVGGKEYVSILTNYGALVGFEEKQDEMKKGNVIPYSQRWIIDLLLYIFPESTNETWEHMHISFVSALFAAVNEHVMECVRHSFKDLENFKQGKVQENAPNQEA